MAANLEYVDGKAQMFSVGSTWHMEGVIRDRPPADTAECQKLAGSGFLDISKAPLFLSDGTPLSTHRALKRADGKILSVCSDSYGLIQPREMLYTFDPAIVEGRATWETAGSLRDGKTIWALAKLAVDPFEAVKGDPIESYIVITQSFDLRDPLRAFYTPIRVVCANTLGSAMSQNQRNASANVAIDADTLDGIEARSISIRHTANAAQRLDEAARILRIAERAQTATVAVFKRMAAKMMANDDALAYLAAVIPDDATVGDQSKRVRARDEILNLAMTGAGADIAGVRGSLYGLYQGVTAWVDHSRGSIGGKLPESRQLGDGVRLTNAFLGVGSTIKARGMRIAQELVTV